VALPPSPLEDKHQIRQEQQQVHGAEQDICTGTGGGQDTQYQGQEQQSRVYGVKAEDDGLVFDESDGQRGRLTVMLGRLLFFGIVKQRIALLLQNPAVPPEASYGPPKKSLGAHTRP
jgi:hypothetical protein